MTTSRISSYVMRIVQWIAKSIPIVSKIAQWIADALKGIANWLIAIWNDPIKTIKDSLSYIGDNIVGWIKSALNPFNFDTKWGVFAIDFAKILAYFPRIGGYILDLIPNILKGAWYAIRLLTKVFFPHVYTAFRIFNIMLNKYIKPMFGFLGKALGWISTNFSPRKILSEANKFIQNILKGLYTKAGNALADIKFLGKLSGRLLKLGAIGSKGIPVVGAIATAGFGTYEAYQAGRKMAGEDGGFNWGVASQYMAKTAVATTLTGLGYSPAGLAVDLAGTAALNRYHGGSFLTLEVDSGDGTTTSVEMYETAVANSRARIRLNVVSEGG